MSIKDWAWASALKVNGVQAIIGFLATLLIFRDLALAAAWVVGSLIPLPFAAWWFKVKNRSI